MAELLQLEIVTPDKRVVEAQASAVQIPGKTGELGILPGHAPLLTELAVGVISYVADGATERLSVAWGFAEVLPDKVTILAETAETADEIDVARAQASLDRNKKRLSSDKDEVDRQRAAESVARAEARLEVAQGVVRN